MSDGNGIQVANVPTEEEMGKIGEIFNRALQSIPAMAQLQKDMEGLRVEVNALRSDLETERRRYATLEETLGHVRSQRDTAFGQVNELNRDLAQVRHSLDIAQTTVKAQAEEIEGKARWLKALEDDNVKAWARVREAEAELSRTKGTLERTSTNLDLVSNRALELESLLDLMGEDRDEARKDAAKLREELDKAHKKLSALQDTFHNVFAPMAVAAFEASNEAVKSAVSAPEVAQASPSETGTGAQTVQEGSVSEGSHYTEPMASDTKTFDPGEPPHPVFDQVPASATEEQAKSEDHGSADSLPQGGSQPVASDTTAEEPDPFHRPNNDGRSFW
jgi:archaellum component FlaC